MYGESEMHYKMLMRAIKYIIYKTVMLCASSRSTKLGGAFQFPKKEFSNFKIMRNHLCRLQLEQIIIMSDYKSERLERD